MKFFYLEYKEIKEFVEENSKVILILGVSTLSLILNWYHQVTSSQAISQFIYFIIIPIFVICFVLRDNPIHYGIRIGNFSIWVKYVIITILFSMPILFFASRFSQISKFYSKQFNYFSYFYTMVPILLAWEFLLRGFLLFGLSEKFGKASIIIQMVPFVLLHLGKPEAETLSCILTGLWFGWIAYRGRSFWPAFIIHLFINIATNFFVSI